MAGGAECDGQGDVFGAGAEAAFLATAVDQRFQPHPRPHVQGPDTLGGIQFMSDDREQIHAQLVGIHRQFAERLGRVGVNEHATASGNRGHLADRLKRADLVVGVHQRDQNRGRCEGCGDGVRVHAAECVHADNGQRRAEVNEPPGWSPTQPGARRAQVTT